MQISHRTDEADALFASWNLIVSGWTIRMERRFRDQIAVARLDRTFRFRNRKKILLAQHCGRAHRHHFNETQNEILRGSELKQRNDLVFIAAAHQHRVQFDLFESGGDRSLNSLEHCGKKIATGDLGVNIPIQGIE